MGGGRKLWRKKFYKKLGFRETVTIGKWTRMIKNAVTKENKGDANS